MAKSNRYVPLTITYQESGLVRDRQAFVLADDAYQELTNCFLFRGRLRRRQGYNLLGRLRRDVVAQSLGNMPASTTFTYADILTSFRATQPESSLVLGSVVLTFTNGAPVVLTDNGAGGWTVTSGTATISSASSINYQTGAVSIVFTANEPTAASAVTVTYAYYPCLPVMGLPTYDLAAINAHQTMAFDTIYGYQYSNALNKFIRITAVTNTTWNGSDSDFFQTLTYWYTSDGRPYFWVTNFNMTGATRDPIRLYDGVDWSTFAPTTSGTDEMHNALLLIPYRGRLVALNTYEGANLNAATQFPQRARWSQNGAPFTSVAAGTPPVAANEWRSDIKGRGGYIDAPTNEQIVSAEFIRDLLVVGFEHSTWCLRYTGNEILPFVWERINVELGSLSPNGMIPFDKGILYMGDKSINSCSGTNVDRIDEKIPTQIFEISSSDDPTNSLNKGPRRVAGIRDFFERLVYWTYPDAKTRATFPNRVLVFNYDNQSWARFTDCFTCFGQYQRFNDLTWADILNTWETMNEPWVSTKLQSQFPDIIAGNQQGFVLIMNKQVSNDESLYISSLTTSSGAVSIESVNHNLAEGEFVLVSGIIGAGATELNNRIFQVQEVVDADNIKLGCFPRVNITAITADDLAVVTCPGHTFEVDDRWYIDQVAGMTEINGLNGVILAVSGSDVTIDIDSSAFSAYTSGGQIQDLSNTIQNAVVSSGTYGGGGVMARMMSFTAKSKKYNLLGDASKATLGYIDFLADCTKNGEVACQIFTDYNDATPYNDGNDSFFNTVFSTAAEAFSQSSISKDWHRFFCNANCQFFDYSLTLNDAQCSTPAIVDSDVFIDSLIIYSGNGGRLVN